MAYAVVFIGDGLTHFGALVSWFLGFLVGWLCGSSYVLILWVVHADSAGCSLGGFSHWWRSESEPVFGEGGFHTSVALASTVLLGHP